MKPEITALSAVKGSNRAAQIFTRIIQTVETENKQLHEGWLDMAFTYKIAWEKELERRAQLGIVAPDPIPHPDDIVINAHTGDVNSPKLKRRFGIRRKSLKMNANSPLPCSRENSNAPTTTLIGASFWKIWRLSKNSSQPFADLYPIESHSIGCAEMPKVLTQELPSNIQSLNCGTKTPPHCRTSRQRY